MQKIFVYVDAENVNFAQFDEVYSRIKMENDSVIIHGKVYGSKDLLGSSIQKYMLLGFDYVETSSLSVNKKNLADMKLIVDCTAEVIACEPGVVKKVYVLSHDSDFLPLVYKLTQNGYSVECMILNESYEEYTTTQLNHCLKNMGYFSSDLSTVTSVLYDDLVKRLPAEYSADLIESFVDERKKKFIKEINKFDSALGASIEVIPSREFSFKKVYDAKNTMANTLTEEEAMSLFRCYTSKVFGVLLRNKEVQGYLDDLQCREGVV